VLLYQGDLVKPIYSCLLLTAFVTGLTAQTTGRLEGTVSDPQGAAVPAAQIRVVNTQTGQTLSTITNERGYWVLPSMQTATFRVTASHAGFKTATVDSVKIEASLPATVNIGLEIGAVAETVEVSAGAEMLQTSVATVASTLVGRQLHELPFTSRNITELIVTQAGAATPGIPRTSSINGLPKGAFNVTMDGVNIQDNVNKSSDGFFNSIFPRADAIEEMVVTTAAAGADSTGEGAAQIKLVTRSGSNDWHGGLFWYHRNSVFNANYYFNNIDRLPRDRILFNQVGGLIGGPIKKDRLFFFIHYEAFRLPQDYPSPNQTVLTSDALQGLYRYRDSAGQVRTVDLYQLAQNRNPSLPASVRPFAATPDPIIFGTLNRIAQLATPATGNLNSRIQSNNDYNRNNFNFQTRGKNDRDFPTLRLDWNATSKHHVEFVGNYQRNLRLPDGINTAIPILPGTGIVLGSEVIGNQRGRAFSAVAAVRSTLAANLTSEVRFGLTGGTVIFNDGVTPADFAQWRGYAPTLSFVNNAHRSTGQTRRNTPLKQSNANLTWSRSSHLWNFGGSFTEVVAWSTGSNGSQFVPGVTIGTIAANDPVNFGATSLFDTVNFPGSTPAQRTDAANLYALLTGRVSSIARSVVLDEETKTYGAFPPLTRNRQREFALYFQDSWRVRPGFTFNYGLRWDRQNPYENLNGIYTRPGYEGVWGISGVGNLFRPGVLTGQVPVYNAVEAGTPAYQGSSKHFSPSVGLAWVLPKTDFRPLQWLAGRRGQTVLRAGYAIATVREDIGQFAGVWGSNQGRTFTTSVDPNNFPAQFGQPGSVLFRDAALPARTAPTRPSYPIAVLAGNAVRDFHPDLGVGYVQSWTLGLQREILRDTVLEVRYVGNHGTGLWRRVDLNEVNIFENGFLNEFKIAQSNLAIARAASPASINFGNAGIAGQRDIPIIRTALNTTSDTAIATQIERGQAGTLANAIATNAQRMGRLTAAGHPANLFLVNPTLLDGDASLLINSAHTTYNALQVEVRRRMSAGLLLQGSYTWSKALSNEFTNGVGGSYTSFRNQAFDKGVSPWDIRHGVKLNWIYELPFGPGRQRLSNFQNPFARRVLEGWEVASVTRIQSGSPELLTGGRPTFNEFDSGVVLHNLTTKQLQEMVQIRKVTAADGRGLVYYLPQALVDNSLAAFEVGGKTLRDLDPTKPYIGPPTTPGELGSRIFFYGPGQQKWDFSIIKKTYLGERRNIEFRAQFLNAFNVTNFLLGAAGNTVNTTGVPADFGQTRSAYRDLTNTNDPGARVIEFVLRFNF